MYDLFFNDLTAFAQKCGDYFSQGKLKEYFSQLCDYSKMYEYYDTFSRHSDGGKRIRAYLVKLGYEISGNDCDESILSPAISYELFQTGVLSHDDIIDQSPTRRHKMSMYMELGGDHTGVSRAICQGDFGIIASLDIIARSDFDDTTKLKALQHQSSVFFSTVAGELEDVDLSAQEFHPQDRILSMYRLKTAQYTVSGPLVLGAILANVSDEKCHKLKLIGDNIGIAFQIKDDILGIYGDEKAVGKSIFSDMREGKKTVLSAHFLDSALPNDKELFDSIYGKSSSGEEQLNTVKALFDKYGSLEYANTLCRNYVDKAKQQLDCFELNSHTREIFTQMLEYMTTRQK